MSGAHIHILHPAVINMKFAQNRHFYKVSTANIAHTPLVHTFKWHGEEVPAYWLKRNETKTPAKQRRRRRRVRNECRIVKQNSIQVTRPSPCPRMWLPVPSPCISLSWHALAPVRSWIFLMAQVVTADAAEVEHGFWDFFRGFCTQ